MAAQDSSTDWLSKVRSEYRLQLPRDILGGPVRALMGVTQAAADGLEEFHVESVFDLATSSLFADAVRLTDAASDRTSAISQHGAAPRDMLDDDALASTEPQAFNTLPLSALRRLSSAAAGRLEEALDVSTLGELADYLPYQSARKLLQHVYFPDNASGADPERPRDLIPRSGEYPTERVQYSTLLLDEIPLDSKSKLVDIASADFAPIDLGALSKADSGFSKPAMGALLTFNQSWYAQGLTLGQLLHSTSLAPGESTRIAVIDWSRRSRAGQTESVSEADELTNDQSHNRSIEEVVNAVAVEAQSGFSATAVASESAASGTSGASEMSAPLGGLLGGPSGSMGFSSASATNNAAATSVSVSTGRRSISSDMTQNINDRTHQHASSSRSRRASVVKEVSQSEHENVSTRTLANYNHMHALTIQYYEVVQVFRTEVALAKAERVVYIPFKLLDFGKDEIVQRFRPALIRAAINWSIRQALLNLDVIEIELDRESHFGSLGERLGDVLSAAISVGLHIPTGIVKRVAEQKRSTDTKEAKEKADQDSGESVGSKVAARTSVAFRSSKTLQQALWDVDRASELSSLWGQSLLHRDSTSLYLPSDVLVEGAEVEAGEANVKVVFEGRSGELKEPPSLEAPIALGEIRRISLKGDSPEENQLATVTLTLNRSSLRYPIRLPSVRLIQGTKRQTALVSVRNHAVDKSLKEHLQANRLHYSSAVLRSLDTTDLALLLAGYTMQHQGRTVPVSQVVEPRPHAVVGNYLAFKMASDITADPEWAKWLDDHGIKIGYTESQLVPLGTGGTFAEAVLGRSNSAERLDMTRFWNWQDSPIPLQPTEIAAIQTGSRAIAEDLSPSALSNPIVNITTPTTLPDPTATAGALAAIQNGQMFRDMSGLAETIGLANSALKASAAGAATAGQQAGENMNNLLKANTERQRAAAQMISSVASSLFGGSGSGTQIAPGTHSEQGAKVNYFDDTKTPVQPGSSSGSGPGSVPSGNGQSGGGGASGGSGNGGAGGWHEVTPRSVYSDNPAIRAANYNPAEALQGVMERAKDIMNPTNPPVTPRANLVHPIPSVAVATDAADKVDLAGRSDTMVFNDPPGHELPIPGIDIENWRASGVSQYGGTTVSRVRNDAEIDLLVLHENLGNSWSDPAGLSVHAHIERDGTLRQHNSFYHLCSHAKRYNEHSIGIEHVNIPYTASDKQNGRTFELAIKAPQKGLGYLALPPEEELEASIRAIDAILARFPTIPLAFPQFIRGSRLFGPGSSKGEANYWLYSTLGWDWFGESGQRPRGVCAHAPLGRDASDPGHDDGAFLPLYYYLRIRGVAPDDCISEIGRLVTDASLHTTYHFNDNIILHMVKLT